MKKIGLRPVSAFTLVELLVVVLIIGLLASIAIPNFLTAQNKAKEASVKGNMHAAQVAAESYACDYAGIYPSTVAAAYESFFPGGGSDSSTAGNPLTNPYTHTSGFPSLGAGLTPAHIGTLRTSSGNKVAGGTSGIEYDAVSSGGYQTGYGILGANAEGQGVSSYTHASTLVLSNM